MGEGSKSVQVGRLIQGQQGRGLIYIIDLINRTVQVLRENLYWIRISAQDAGLMELVKLWDEG